MSAFLEGGLNFARIPAVIESVMATTSGGEIRDLDDVLAADAEARERRFFLHPAARRARLRALRWNVGWNVLWFIVGVSLLVTVHEFGHYWVARKLGFKVLRFSVGFGKPLFKQVGRAPDHTEYVIAALPLGGYVKMLDERDGAWRRRPAARLREQAAVATHPGAAGRPRGQHPLRDPGAVGPVLGQRHRSGASAVVDEVVAGSPAAARGPAQRRRDALINGERVQDQGDGRSPRVVRRHQ